MRWLMRRLRRVFRRERGRTEQTQERLGNAAEEVDHWQDKLESRLEQARLERLRAEARMMGRREHDAREG